MLKGSVLRASEVRVAWSVAVKGQRAGDAAGDTGQGQSCVAVQAGVREITALFCGQRAPSKVFKLG